MDHEGQFSKISARWVMLQKPGWNFATVGALIMVAAYVGLLGVYWMAGQDGAGLVMGFLEFFGLRWQSLKSGEVWQLVTHLFFHGSWQHLLINVLLFYYAAARLSHILSGWRVLGLFLLSGLMGGLAHVLVQALVPQLPGLTLVGASGGIMGLLVGFFVISPDSRMLFFGISARNLARGVLISSSLLFLTTPQLAIPVLADLGRLFDPAIFQVAHLVHFVGGVTGWVAIGHFFPRLLSAADLARMRLGNESGSAASSPSLTVGSRPD